MRLVVLDVVELRAQRVRPTPSAAASSPRTSRTFAMFASRARDVARDCAAGASVLQHLRAEVRARVAADRDVVEVAGGEAGVREAPRGRLRGEAGDVLDAVEALLLGRRDELAVDDERGGRVAVVGVEAEDRRHGRLMLVTCRRRST